MGRVDSCAMCLRGMLMHAAPAIHRQREADAFGGVAESVGERPTVAIDSSRRI